MPVATFPGNRNWGYDGVFAFAPHPRLRRAGGPRAPRRRRAPRGARRDPRRRLQPPRPRRGVHGARPVTSPTGTRHALGRGDRLLAASRCASGRSRTPCSGRATTASTGCGSTRSSRSTTSPSRTSCASSPSACTRRSPGALVIAEEEVGDDGADRGVGPRRAVGRRAPPRAARAADRRDARLLRGLRHGRPASRGSSSGRRAERLVVCSQNHDQVGNRAFGDRPRAAELRAARRDASSSRRRRRCSSWARSTASGAPFMFFTDHDDPEIAEATREGAREFASSASRDDVPDPQALATFERSKLDARGGCREMRDLYRDLLALRRGLPREIETDAGRRGARRCARGAASTCSRSTSRTKDGERPVTEVWPGRPFPLGPVWDGAGHELLALLRARRARRALPLRRRRPRDAGRADRAHGVQLARLPPRRRAGPALRLPRPRPVRAERRACASTRPSCCSTRTRRRSRDRSATTARTRSRTSPAATTPTSSSTTRTTRRRSRSASSIDQGFDWEGDRPAGHALARDGDLRGARQGLHEAPSRRARGPARHVRRPRLRRRRSRTCSELGVTAVELLPIHHIADEHFLFDNGLTNYWGYSYDRLPRAARAATRRRARGGEQVREFKGMVKALHRAGIEVILDVVYNHTAEGNHLGPMLSFKGIDNPAYYRLSPEDQRFYMDFTGTGNSLNPVHPSVLRLIMDSLRYWAVDCRSTGSASTSPRRSRASSTTSTGSRRSSTSSTRTPILSQVKLIAEPWDVGPGRLPGRQLPGALGRVERPLPRHRARLLARRDLDRRLRARASPARATSTATTAATRRRRSTSSPRTTASRCATSSRTTRSTTRRTSRTTATAPTTTARWNCGVEGPTDDPEVNALRARQQRNFLATLLLSQGVPMLLGGDEIGRTQGGNNNAWCQDNEISWFDWDARRPRSCSRSRGG